MPVNIEIKAVVRCAEKVRQLAQEISGHSGTRIVQKDIFYKVPCGRLKLRFLQEEPSQLVFYERQDKSGPKRSDFKISTVTDPNETHGVLERALGIRGIVEKERMLHMVGQTRIHLDKVKGLGDFLELEVMLREDQSDEDGQKVAEDLMKQLGVDKSDLVDVAYVDLLLAHSEQERETQNESNRPN